LVVAQLVSTRLARALGGLAVSAALAVLASSSPSLAAGEATGPGEYELKATFLFNFTKYATWPDDAFERADSPFVVGVLGPDPFKDVLDRTMKDKVAAGRRIVVERYPRMSQVGSPHLLFVTERDPALAGAVPKEFAKRPILLVGDCEEFATVGGGVGFFLRRGDLRFAINPDALARARISVSVQVMKLARIVKDR